MRLLHVAAIAVALVCAVTVRASETDRAEFHLADALKNGVVTVMSEGVGHGAAVSHQLSGSRASAAVRAEQEQVDSDPLSLSESSPSLSEGTSTSAASSAVQGDAATTTTTQGAVRRTVRESGRYSKRRGKHQGAAGGSTTVVANKNFMSIMEDADGRPLPPELLDAEQKLNNQEEQKKQLKRQLKRAQIQAHTGGSEDDAQQQKKQQQQKQKQAQQKPQTQQTPRFKQIPAAAQAAAEEDQAQDGEEDGVLREVREAQEGAAKTNARNAINDARRAAQARNRALLRRK